MEVKGIVRWGEDWRNVVVGELLSVERHPRADRLSLTRVNVGSGEPLDIVCGATNIAAGQRVPVALPGAVLPGDRRIERTEKMGVVSNGMLCSGDELGLTADADGILILPADAPIGTPLVDLFGDVVLDVDVKPNRGDALSIVGLAREVAAVTGGPLRLPPTDLVETGRPTAERLRVDVLDPDLCPRFVGRWVSDVRVGPSPDAVQMRLLAAGHRPDQQRRGRVQLRDGRAGQADPHVRRRRGPRRPDHRPAGDARGSRSRRSTTSSASWTPTRWSSPTPPGPIGIAGVMGGVSSEIGEGTTDVVVESAIFDPISIRRTAFRYALRSDASLRFEKGQEWRLARVGADRTARLIAEWAGGQVAPGAVDTAPDDPPQPRVAFRPARVNRLLGTEIGTDDQRALLARVGIETAPAAGPTTIRVAAGSKPLEVEAGDAEVIEATIPTWRRDLLVEADLTEEIIRVRGYELVPASLPDTPMPTLPTRSAGRSHGRPADAHRRGPDRGRDAGPRRAQARRAVPGARRRGARRRTGAATRRPAGRRHQPAVQPALGPPPEPARQPPRGRLDQPPVRPRRRRDLRGRQGLWRARTSGRPTSGGGSAWR